MLSSLFGLNDALSNVRFALTFIYVTYDYVHTYSVVENAGKTEFFFFISSLSSRL
jgi:hypothetical protein